MFYGLVTVVQYLTGVFCPAGDLTVLVAVVQYLTHVLWPAGDLPVLLTVFGVSDWCVLSCRRSPCFGDCFKYLTRVFCPAGDLPVLVTVVQYLTHVLWPAGDLPVLVTVVQNVTGVFCPAGDLPVLVTVAVSDWCFFLSCRRSPCFGDCGSECDWCVLSCRSPCFGDCVAVSDWCFFCPAGDLPVLENLVTGSEFGVFCPADLPVLVAVFQYLTGAFLSCRRSHCCPRWS